jgi:hypothetical protein
MHRLVPALLFLAFAPAAATPAVAQQNSRTATLNVRVRGLAKLSISPPSLVFPDADPDSTPQIPSSGGPLTLVVKARVTPGVPIRLTVQAADDLRSGPDVIPASALSWTVTGRGFTDGTVDVANGQTVGSWSHSGRHTGTQHYVLANSWSYALGIYSLTLVYTLTVQ